MRCSRRSAAVVLLKRIPMKSETMTSCAASQTFETLLQTALIQHELLSDRLVALPHATSSRRVSLGQLGEQAEVMEADAGPHAVALDPDGEERQCPLLQGAENSRSGSCELEWERVQHLEP